MLGHSLVHVYFPQHNIAESKTSCAGQKCLSGGLAHSLATLGVHAYEVFVVLPVTFERLDAKFMVMEEVVLKVSQLIGQLGIVTIFDRLRILFIGNRSSSHNSPEMMGLDQGGKE
jgi:hypothetical protein